MSLERKERKNNNKLLLIFVHGFKGNDKTFGDFPNRLQDVIKATKNIDTESIIYPKYETRGNLHLAVETFCGWLEDKVKIHEEMIKGKGIVWVCLCGHSMGGILAADTILRYESLISKPVNIIGLLAFDTPYYGIHVNVFSKAALEKAASYNRTIGTTISLISSATGFYSGAIATSNNSATVKKSSGFGKFGIAALTSAAIIGGAAYMHKEKVAKGVDWLGSHLEYISPTNANTSSRTFISPPPPETMIYFSPAVSTASDEIDAHVSMFDPNENHHYFDLGQVALQKLSEMIEKWEILHD
ncbi:11758_t:CDS:2 [Diversispora eburnea]|uniref:11758_t:CDS:1 n=1 Tax=Diversispora eburnea TaxID=1213867 RepID=A0A9N9AUZ7_9GLOM|nr:11758_t:CDS:2 [Diversispora eburnea]